MNIVPANLAKRSGAAILDFLMALLLWLALITFVVSPIYDSLFDTKTLQQDYVAIQLDSRLYIEDPETTVITYVATEDLPEAIYDYYALFRDDKAFGDETTPFAFSNEWYNEHVLLIGSSDEDVTVYFEYDVDELDQPDPSKVGVPLATATQEELDAFYVKAYSNAQSDLNTYAPYAALASDISRYSIQILSISGSVSIILFYLAFPLIFKNGQTLAKKLFNLGVVSKQGYKLKLWQIFARFAVFMVELVLSIYTIMGAFLISYTLMIFTKGNRSAHDFLAGTSVVNLKDSLIFTNEDEARAYEDKLRSEEATQAALRPSFKAPITPEPLPEPFEDTSKEENKES